MGLPFAASLENQSFIVARVNIPSEPALRAKRVLWAFPASDVLTWIANEALKSRMSRDHGYILLLSGVTGKDTPPCCYPAPNPVLKM